MSDNNNTPRRGAKPGNSNARNASGEAFDSAIRIECHSAQKGRWKTAAGARKLAAVMREQMDLWADAQLG